MNSITPLDYALLKERNIDIEKALEKIEKGYPIQYIIGDVSFYGYPFYVNESVLIPRFETEYLIEKTIKLIKKLGLETSKMIDVGTGSGCIAITLKKELQNLDVSALDISLKALEVAETNAKQNQTPITFINADIFEYTFNTDYSIIVSNPPYIDRNSKYDKKIKYEPDNAIFVDGDLLKYYKVILQKSIFLNSKKHLLAFEIDEDKKNELLEIARIYFPNDSIYVEKDLAGKDRYLFVHN